MKKGKNTSNENYTVKIEQKKSRIVEKAVRDADRAYSYKPKDRPEPPLPKSGFKTSK